VQHDVKVEFVYGGIPLLKIGAVAVPRVAADGTPKPTPTVPILS